MKILEFHHLREATNYKHSHQQEVIGLPQVKFASPTEIIYILKIKGERG